MATEDGRAQEKTLVVILLTVAFICIVYSIDDDQGGFPWKKLVGKFGMAFMVAGLVRVFSWFWGLRNFLALKRYWSFDDCGMRAAHKKIGNKEMGRRIAKASNVRVLKTWFPEDSTLEEGLLDCLEAKNNVELFLACPDDATLGVRSLAATGKFDRGRDTIIKSLNNLVSHPGAGSIRLSVTFYKGWPAAPIIWLDSVIYLGFYLNGHASTYWPWLEIEPESFFGRKLAAQFDELDICQTLESASEVENWLAQQ